MNRSESKFNNSAKKMQAALITLLENKDFADINVMDICQSAGVNRSTFYAHYGNTYDLLNEVHASLINNFLEECSFDSPVDMSDINKLDKDELVFISPKYLLPYLKYIQRHKQLFKIYAENTVVFDSNTMDDALMKNVFSPVCAKYGITDKKVVGYMEKYYLKGIDAIISEWVHNDCEDDILFICEIIIYCVRPTSRKAR